MSEGTQGRKHSEDALLDQLLTTLDVRIKVFALCEVGPGWRLSFGSNENPSLHYVLSGSGMIGVPDLSPIPLSRDTFVIIPRGFPHYFEGPGGVRREMHHDPGSNARGSGLPIIQAVDERCADEEENSLLVVCGTVHASFGGALGLFERLRYPIAENFQNNPLGERFRDFLEELKAPSLGTRALTEAFLKQAVVLVLRRQMREGGGSITWLNAFRDPSLAPVISAMLERPGNPFTLEDLASSVGVSRSVFAQRFSAAFGQPPMEFLKYVRLHRVAHLLEVTGLPVKAVAKSVGYESRSYFSRAFRAAHGVDPTDYRARQHIRAISIAGSTADA